MLKRLFLLPVAASVALSIGACSGVPSEEDMVAQAVDLDWRTVVDERLENEARAIGEWDGKIVRYDCKVWDVGADSAEVYSETSNGYPLDSIDVTFASEDDLLAIERGARITVVGELDIEGIDKIINAYLVSD